MLDGHGVEARDSPNTHDFRVMICVSEVDKIREGRRPGSQCHARFPGLPPGMVSMRAMNTHNAAMSVVSMGSCQARFDNSCTYRSNTIGNHHCNLLHSC